MPESPVLAFAPLHKRAFGVATGTAAALIRLFSIETVCADCIDSTQMPRHWPVTPAGCVALIKLLRIAQGDAPA